MDRIRVLFGDDQVLFLNSLRYVIGATATDIEIVACVNDGEQAVDTARRLRPDVVVLDVRMPRLDGVEAARQILRENPSTAVIMLTAFDDDAYVHEAVNHGAAGYLLKDIPPENLIDAIRAVRAGAVMLSPSVARKLVGQIDESKRGHDPPSWTEGLTSRDHDILVGISKGMSNREIADLLNLSEQTVKNYTSALYAKIGARNRSEAAGLAREL